MADYKVGYGKPPQHTKFKKGQSGNPDGGRKHKKKKTHAIPDARDQQIKAFFLLEAFRLITVRDGKKEIPMTVAQAIIRSLAVQAAKGGVRVQKYFIEMLRLIEDRNQQAYLGWAEAMLKAKAEGEAELQRREQLKITGPDLIPHPHDIIFDPETGNVEVRGPRTMEEARLWDYVEETADTIEWLKSLPPEEKEKIDYRKNLAFEYKMLRKVLGALPNYRNCPSRRARRS